MTRSLYASDNAQVYCDKIKLSFRLHTADIVHISGRADFPGSEKQPVFLSKP